MLKKCDITQKMVVIYLNSRQKNIIQILEREGEVTIKALSERLDVSEFSI